MVRAVIPAKMTKMTTTLQLITFKERTPTGDCPSKAMQTIQLKLVSLQCLDLYSSAAPHVSLRKLRLLPIHQQSWPLSLKSKKCLSLEWQ
jgi:hypothetical protein